MNGFIRITLVLIATFASVRVKADGDMQYDVAVGLQYYAGETKKSIHSATGSQLRFGAESGPRSMFRWFSAFTLISASSENTFDDAGTDRTLSYSHLAGEFDLGLKISPLIGLAKLPVQPYLGAAGAVQAASFVFPKDSTVSATFPKTDSATLYGFTMFVGSDILIGKDWGMQFHVEQATISGQIVKSTISLGGNRYYFGIFFQN